MKFDDKFYFKSEILKLHKVLVEAVVDGIKDVFISNQQADKVVEQLLKSNKKWGKRDRAFIAENIYEICRWWELVKYSYGLQENATKKDLWHLFGTWWIIKPAHLQLEETTLPDWAEFEELVVDDIIARYQEGLTKRHIAQSIPAWLDKIGEEELKGNWNNELSALNKQAPFVLRVNSLKTTKEKVVEIFGSEDSSFVDSAPDAIILKKRQNVFARDSFKMGYFEVQDAGSQLIAPFLDIQSGQTVIDACAGAGGKTLHIAALLGNKGKVVAMDIEHGKLIELERRAKRNGATCVETQIIHSDEDIVPLVGTADRLLLDVPCSGLGVLRRHPDSKWKLKPAFLTNIREVQWHILNTYSLMVKPGGKMVYATCSILPSESEKQVARFVTENRKAWKLVKEHRTSPATDDFDGFYMALLEKLPE